MFHRISIMMQKKKQFLKFQKFQEIFHFLFHTHFLCTFSIRICLITPKIWMKCIPKVNDTFLFSTSHILAIFTHRKVLFLSICEVLIGDHISKVSCSLKFQWERQKNEKKIKFLYFESSRPLDSERMDGFQKFKRQNKRLNLVFKMIPIRFLWNKY